MRYIFVALIIMCSYLAWRSYQRLTETEAAVEEAERVIKKARYG